MRVATWNLGSKPNDDVMHGLVRLLEHHQILGVQEAGDRDAALAGARRATGCRVLRGDGDGQAKVALLVSEPVEATDWYPCTPATYVGPLGAGPSTISPKGVRWARVPGLTVGVTHMVPSVQRPPFPGRKRRRALYAKHVAAIVEWASKVEGPLVLLGDFNATPDYFQLRPLRDAGFTLHTRPSHGRRAIDYVAVRGLKAGDVSALTGYPSDHRPVVATLSVPQEAPVTRGLYPAAVKKLIPPGANDPAITPRIAILHVDAGDSPSLYEYFRDRSGGVESHFHVRKDGAVEQYRNIFWQADANLDANDFAVSIETQGRGAGEWNAAQLAAIKKLLLWLRDEAGIPLIRCTAWDGRGVGYHTMFGAPSHWTPVAKTCPGPDRVVQFSELLVPWMRSLQSRPTPRWNRLVELLDEVREVAGSIVEGAPDESPRDRAAREIRASARISREIAAKYSEEF